MYFYAGDTTPHIIISTRAPQIIMEMKHRSVHRATFSIISAQNALETALFQKKKMEKITQNIHATLQNHKIQSERVISGVSAPLLEKWRDHLVYTGQRNHQNLSYLILAGARAWDPALYIPTKHRVCCMMEDAHGPARLILSQGRDEWIAGYAAAQACLASPGKTSRGV